MSMLLTAREAAAYCGQSYRGFDQFVRRHGVPCDWWGGQRRFRRETLDRVRKAMTERHADLQRRKAVA